VKKLTIGLVVTELILFVIVAVWLQSPGESGAPAAPGFTGDFGQFTAIKPRPPAPRQTIVDGTGTVVSLSRFRGRVLLLNFWATWCGPCKREMPALDRLQAALGGPAFAVITVSVDRKGKAVVAPWLRANGLGNLPLYLDPGRRLFRAFGATGLPTSFVIDHRGRVAGVIEGAAEWDSAAAKAFLGYFIRAARAGS